MRVGWHWSTQRQRHTSSAAEACLTLSGCAMSSFMVTIDGVGYRAKPHGREVADITRRLQRAGATECDAATFCEHVKQGRTWTGGTFEPCAGKWGEFTGQQLFALDFDNSAPGTDGHGKRPLCQGETGYLDPVDALDRCEQLGLAPLCLYFTMGAKCPDWPKYRLVFDMGELLDQDTAQAVIQSLLTAFPESDQACKNLNRLFFGSNGEVWECWRLWDDAG